MFCTRLWKADWYILFLSNISFTEPTRLFTRIIEARDQNQSKRAIQFDYDNRATILIIIFQTCAVGCYVNKSEKYRVRLLIIDNCIDVSSVLKMSRRKQARPRHVDDPDLESPAIAANSVGKKLRIFMLLYFFCR